MYSRYFCSRWTHLVTYMRNKGKTKRSRKAETQDGETLFASERDYQRAWQRFQTGEFAYLTPHQCKGKPKEQAFDCVLAADFGVNAAYECTAVDKNRICIADRVTEVEFWYAQKNRKWVLNTAYPSDSNTPTHACRKIHGTLTKAQETSAITSLCLCRSICILIELKEILRNT